MSFGDWTEIQTSGGSWFPLPSGAQFTTNSNSTPQSFLVRASGTIAGTLSVTLKTGSIGGSTGEAGIIFLLKSSTYTSANCYALTLQTVNNNYHLRKYTDGVQAELFDHPTVGVASAFTNTTTLSALWIVDETRFSGTFIQVAANTGALYTIIDTVNPHVTTVAQGLAFFGQAIGAVNATSAVFASCIFATLSATALFVP